jgi:hypothetical protein
MRFAGLDAELVKASGQATEPKIRTEASDATEEREVRTFDHGMSVRFKQRESTDNPALAVATLSPTIELATKATPRSAGARKSVLAMENRQALHPSRSTPPSQCDVPLIRLC